MRPFTSEGPPDSTSGALVPADDPADDEPRLLDAGPGLDAIDEHPRFPVVLRGYDRVSVDEYVSSVRAVVADLRANQSPKAAIRRAIDRLGEETSTILQQAHDTAAEVTSRSRAEADDRIQRADREGAEIRRAAEARVRELDADIDALWQERQRLLGDVRRIAHELEEVVGSALERFPAEDADEEARAGGLDFADDVALGAPGSAPVLDADLHAGEPRVLESDGFDLEPGLAPGRGEPPGPLLPAPDGEGPLDGTEPYEVDPSGFDEQPTLESPALPADLDEEPGAVSAEAWLEGQRTEGDDRPLDRD